jgi:hypothetical protein
MRGKPYGYLVPADLETHFSKAIIDGSPGEIVVTMQCWEDDLITLRIGGVCSVSGLDTRALPGKLFGSNDAGSRQLERATTNPRDYGVKRNGR